MIKFFFTFSAIFTLFSTATIAKKSSALPVKFIRFEADQIGDMVQLKWLTDSEYNNEFFTIERSQDGNNWLGLGDVDALGTTPGGGTYTFYDEAPVEGLNYYRIKQSDFNGEISYSYIEELVFTNFTGGDDPDFEIYPNPAGGEFFSVNSEFDLTETVVKMMDVAGKEISIEVVKNNTEMTVKPIQRIPGLFFLMIQVGPKSIVKQIKFE